MAHQRTTSTAAGEGLKEPHSVSLKVLRLSRPSLATQHPLPAASTPLAQAIPPTASLAYPSLLSTTPGYDSFYLSPILTLPPTFGNAYVGETFSCTLCANNELPAEDGRKIHGVKIEAEMKTPSTIVPLDVAFVETPEALEAGGTLQGIVEFPLKEEGNHVLAVTISYSETGPTSGRVRSFRKLYQFVARPCLVVRTKTGVLPKGSFALEAQLENCGEDAILLDTVGLDSNPWCKVTGLNWERPVLGAGDVQQVCFLIERVEQDVDDRFIGQLNIGWRGAMGNRGSLSTGSLATRR